MPDAGPRADADAERAVEDGEEPLDLDLAALRARGDVEGLLVAAKAFRSGAAPGGRDLARCLEAYRAAAELGSADAEYAVALFCMSGGIVPQDTREGATRLRAAAEKGSVAAKVYLGNLYELGLHYKANPEKADVWYRNAARGAQLTSSPGSDAFARELAELGCVRHVLALVEGGAPLDGAEKDRLLQRARAHGYGLVLREARASAPADPVAAGERATFLDELQKVEARSAKDAARGPDGRRALGAPAASGLAELDERATPRAKKAGPSRAAALAAFGYALLFVLAGAGAGYAATLGARELLAHGRPLPGLGARVHLVFPILLGAVGVLPTWLVYRLGTVLKALVVAATVAGVGWVLWGTGRVVLTGDRVVQALAFGIAGFLAGLLVLGLLGGTKKRS